MNGRMIRRWLIVAAACPLLGGGCFGGGCIRGEVVSFVRYDAAADSFAFLEVYANVNSWKEAHYDRIADLWRRRGGLIVASPARFRLFGEPTMIERLGKHAYREVDIGDKPAQEPAASATAVDLDTIRVIPGTFFRNEHGGLCYAQGSVVPGPTVDAVLVELIPVIARGLGEAAQEAGKPGAKPITWDELRAAMVAELEGGVKPAAKENTGPMNPLDADSLGRLARAAADGSVRLARRGTTGTLVIPLSARDAAEVVATVDLLRQHVARRAQAGKADDQAAVALLGSVEVRAVADPGVEITVRGDPFLADAGRPPPAMPAPDPFWREALPATIAAVRERGIAVDDADLFPALLRRFRAGEPAP